MSEVLALENLYTKVLASFEAEPWEGGESPQPFGWREGEVQLVTPGRIVWTPGGPSGAFGEFLPARQPGRNPRPFVTIGELFTLYVSANDAADPENEQKQYHATRTLFNRWYRAAYEAAYGTFEVIDSSWNTRGKTRTDRRYGAELVVTIAIQAPIMANADGLVNPYRDNPGGGYPARGEGVASVLNVDENFSTSITIPEVEAATTDEITLFGVFDVDGVSIEEGDLVLVWKQSNMDDNGVYVVQSGAWIRSDLMTDPKQGFFVHVNHGDTYSGAGFTLVTSNPITVGVSPLAFEKTSP